MLLFSYTVFIRFLSPSTQSPGLFELDRLSIYPHSRFEWNQGTRDFAMKHFFKARSAVPSTVCHTPMSNCICTVRTNTLTKSVDQEMNKTFLMYSQFSGRCFCKMMTAHRKRCCEKDFSKVHGNIIKWMTHQVIKFKM